MDHQEKVDLSPPEEGERDMGAKEVKKDKEARDLKDIIMEENMTRRGEKAMGRSLKKKRQARDKFCKYTNQYKYLAEIGDRGMAKAWREANKARENWVEPWRLERIL